MNREMDLWLCDQMRRWLLAVANSPSWTLAAITSPDSSPPRTAGIPYCFQSLQGGTRAGLFEHGFLLNVSFGAYQFRMNERMVRVDLYRHHTVLRDSLLASNGRACLLEEFAPHLASSDYHPAETGFKDLKVDNIWVMDGFVVGLR